MGNFSQWSITIVSLIGSSRVLKLGEPKVAVFGLLFALVAWGTFISPSTNAFGAESSKI